MWIGLTREGRDGWEWIDGSRASYSSWGGDEPNNYGGNEACGVMNSIFDWLWADYPCSQPQPVLCENVTPEPEPEPAPPARPVPTYTFVSETKTFSAASATCTAMGGELATIRTAEEQAAAKAVVSAEDVPANQVRRMLLLPRRGDDDDGADD